MARRYYISGEVADGQFFSDDMSASYENAELSYILFYSDAFQNVVVPTSGTVTYEQTSDGAHYREMPDGSFDAANTYDPSRTPPNGLGLAIKGRITLSGVTGATHFTACIWRS